MTTHHFQINEFLGQYQSSACARNRILDYQESINVWSCQRTSFYLKSQRLAKCLLYWLDHAPAWTKHPFSHYLDGGWIWLEIRITISICFKMFAVIAVWYWLTPSNGYAIQTSTHIMLGHTIWTATVRQDPASGWLWYPREWLGPTLRLCAGSGLRTFMA